MDNIVQPPEKLLAINEALLLGSLRQHELVQVAEELNQRLRAEIAERERTDEALRRSETRYRKLFDSIDEGFCIIEKIDSEPGQPVDFRYIEVNPAFALNSGLADVLGKTMREVTPEGAEDWFEIYDRVARTGEAIRFEHGLVAEGRVLDLHASRIEDGTAHHIAVLFNDVTLRKRAEEALTASDIKFRDMADNIPQLAWLASRQRGGEGHVHWFNRAWLDYTGTTLEQNTGAGWKAAHHPDYVDKVAEKFTRHLREGRDWEDTFPLRGKDGSYRWFLSRMKAIRDESGEVVRFFGTNTDVTDRRALEDNLRASEARYRMLFSALPVAAFVCDRDATIQYYNARAAQLWQRQPEVGVDRHCGSMRLFLPDGTLLPHEQSPMMEVMHTGIAARNVEVAIERPDGSRIPVTVNFAALEDGQGNIVGSVTCFDDITARKTAEFGSAWLAAIVDSSEDAIIGKDLDGIITSWNASAEGIFGFTAQEIIGQSITRLIPPDRLQEESRILGRLRRGEGLNHFDTVRLRKDGSPLEVSLTISPIKDKQGHVVGASKIARDITPRKNVERALVLAKAEAERASHAKTEFLSRMSHELRTPLGAILGFAQLLETGTPALAPSQRRSVDRILQSGWFLLELINEILDLAKIESGKLRVSMEPVPLAEVLRECRDMTEPLMQEFGVDVRLPSPDVGYVVQADRVRLSQILINLLSNAIKYNRAGATVEVQCTASARGRLRVGVADSGEGMTADQLTQLFQPFNRLGQEKSAIEGTGIGLVVCKRLIEAMDGAIGVESTPGKGSVFWIEMNLAAQPRPVLERGKSAAATRANVQPATHAKQTGTT